MYDELQQKVVYHMELEYIYVNTHKIKSDCQGKSKRKG